MTPVLQEVFELLQQERFVLENDDACHVTKSRRPPEPILTSSDQPAVIFPPVRGGLLLGLLGPSLLASLSFAQPVLHLTGREASASLSGHLALLRDPGGTLGIDEAIGSKGWSPLPRGLALGYTKDAVWIRFEVERDPSAKSSWLLELAEATMEDVRLWSLDSPTGLLEQRSGAAVPRAQRPMDYQKPVFRLDLQPGRNRFFVRIRTRFTVAAQLNVYSPESFANESRGASVAWGLFFGAIFSIVVFQLSFWVRTKEPVTAWYAAYIVLYGCTSALTAGLPQQYFGAPVPLSELLRSLTLCGVVGVGSVFNSLALELASTLPRLNRVFLWFALLVSGIGAIFVLAGRVGVGNSTAQAGGLVLMASLLVVSVHLVLRGHAPARLFLIAFGLFFVGASLRFLRNLGVISPGTLPDIGVHVGALANIVTMSFGLSERFSRLKREKDRAQAEALEATRRLAESLESEVAARTVELTKEVRRRGELEEKLQRALEVERAAREVQRDFVGMVSHEFRTPLSIIDAAAQQLRMSPDAPREKTLRRYEKIGIATDRMTSLIDEYLVADRLAGDETTMEVRPSNLRLVIARAVAELPDGRVAVDARGLPERFPCDPDLLQVALRNILANADRHSPPDRLVSLAAGALPDGGVELAVRDEGPGIPPDELPHLFRKFFRGRGTHAGTGAGLGLYLVDRIAHRHGGSVTVESAPGAGTTFRIRLPGPPIG